MIHSKKLLIYIITDCHTLPDGRVKDSKILCPFVSVHMRFLSVPHAVNAFRFVRSYPLASFGHVQNFERTPTDKDVRWMIVSCAFVRDFSGSRASYTM